MMRVDRDLNRYDPSSKHDAYHLQYVPAYTPLARRKTAPKARWRAPFGIRPSPESDVIAIDSEMFALAHLDGKKNWI